MALRYIYNFGIYLFGGIVYILGFFNSKIKLGVDGRKHTFKILKQIPKNRSVFWFHCASLGEYEQGLPVFEALKNNCPESYIVLSFFSPSGYTIRKQSPIADAVIYLPLDTIKNAKRVIALIHPNLVVFVKYDIWPNYLIELKKQRINTSLISALFRKEQIYFKWYGGFFKSAISSFDRIFVQDSASQLVLKTIGVISTVSGDTRFDRVSAQLSKDNTVANIKAFIADSICIVAGSTWPEDDALFIDYVNNNPNSNLKLIIAPHQIQKAYISKLSKAFKNGALLYSEINTKAIPQTNVLIINNIGMLSKLYSYADIAYIGGAMGNTGLHNTLEAAVFGVPIIIGNHFEKFPEAKHMIANGGMVSIANLKAFAAILNTLFKNKTLRLELGQANSNFIKANRGATSLIISQLIKL